MNNDTSPRHPLQPWPHISPLSSARRAASGSSPLSARRGAGGEAEPAIPLPTKIINEPAHMKLIRMTGQKCIAEVKKKVIAALDGEEIKDLDDLTNILLALWQNGYNLGLKHMDKMHKKID